MARIPLQSHRRAQLRLACSVAGPTTANPCPSPPPRVLSCETLGQTESPVFRRLSVSAFTTFTAST